MKKKNLKMHEIDSSRKSLVISKTAIDIFLYALFALAVFYLVQKSFQVSGRAGYDFRYLWLAGEFWAESISPYGVEYLDIDRVRIPTGHIPKVWVYPPNWWIICVSLAGLDLLMAGFVWNLLNIVLLIAASLLLVKAFCAAFPDRTLWAPVLGDLAAHPSRLFCLHFVGMVVLEATAIVLAVGQTSILIYFGFALLLYGLACEHRWLAVAGLAVIFLKPQIGLIFAVVFFLQGSSQRRLVLVSIGVSLILSIPALIVEPAVMLAFVRNLTLYDGVGDANLPQAMTGTRLIIWEVIEIDIGNVVAVLIATVLGLVLTTGRWRLTRAADPAVHGFQTVTLLTVLILFAAPLHYYDFVIIGVLPFAIIGARGLAIGAGVLGGTLILRADDLGEKVGLYDPDVAIFEGSILSTIGGALLCLAVFSALREWQNKEQSTVKP